jgi:hypothetical protein
LRSATSNDRSRRAPPRTPPSATFGAAGIPATVTSLVAQQTHEIGVRLALGATAVDIGRRVLVMRRTDARCLLLSIASASTNACSRTAGVATGGSPSSR